MSKTSPKEKNKATAARKEIKGKKVPADVKAQKVKAAEQNTEWDVFRSIAFWGLAVLLFLPPYFRGLFFAPEQERALIFAGVVFWIAWLWKWGKRDHNFLSHPMDYFVLAFPVVYLISAFQAANYGLAVDEVVKTTLYFMVYWLSSRLARNENDVVTILHVIYISAIGVALAGLATATGIININDGFLNGRIYSTFQYPNALASFLAAVTFLGIYLWRRVSVLRPEEMVSEKNSNDMPAWLKLGFIQYLYAIGNFLLFTVFLGAKSQGGILVFSIVYILFIIGLPKGNRIPVIIHSVFTGLFSLIAISQFLSAVNLTKMGIAWLWIFAGLLLTVAGQILYSFCEKRELLQWISAHKKIIAAVLVLLVICGGIGASVYISGNSDTIKNMAEGIRLRNAAERMYFFQDSMKMFKERPLIGWGGGGWEEAYRANQGYLYNSNEVHGHYFQIMVEVGIIGILVMIGVWASFLYAGHRFYHGAKDNARILVLTITVTAALIGLHAVIDFNLSLSALALVLWTMFGVARGIMIYTQPKLEDRKSSKSYISPNYSVLVIVSAASLIIIVFAGALVSADSYYKQAIMYMQKQNPAQIISSLQKASSYNPFNADYHSNLAQVYQQLGRYDEGISEAQAALRLRKYNSQCYADLASLLISGKKNNEDAVNAAEKALSLAPYQIQWYELLARTYFLVGYNEMSGGNQDTAKGYFEKTLQVPARIQSKIESLGETERQLWKDAPLLSSTAKVNLCVGEAQYIMGMWPEAEASLNEMLQDENSKGEAALWLSILKDKQGKTDEAKVLFDQANQLVPRLAKSYDELKNIPVLK